MKERPILFSAPMVRALLAGRKSQTRRDASDRISPGEYHGFPGSFFTRKLGSRSQYTSGLCEWECPYGKPGDRLWVKETFFDVRPWRHEPRFGGVTGEIIYRAEYEYLEERGQGKVIGAHDWRPSIFMRRAESRLLLEITSVRVERLNEISEGDAQAEGVFFKDYGRRCGHFGQWQPVGDCSAPEHTHPQLPGWSWRETSRHEECLNTARGGFANLWTHVNGPNSWAANPWVWVLTFKGVEVARG